MRNIGIDSKFEEGNNQPQIEEYRKCNGQKQKGQTVQVMIYKALGRVSSSCFTYDTRRITRVTIPVAIVHE